MAPRVPGTRNLPNDLPADIEQVLKILDEKGTLADHKIEVKRRSPHTGEFDHLGAVAPGAFSLDYIKERFGGGEYEFAVRNTVTKGWVKKPRATIAGPPKEDQEVPRAEGGASPELEAVKNEVTTMREVLLAFAQRPEPPRSDDRFDKLLELLLPPLVAAIAKKRDPPGPDPTQMMDMFIRGMELGKESGGGGDSYASIAKELGAPLVKMLGAAPQENPGVFPVLPPPSEAPAPAAQPEVVAEVPLEAPTDPLEYIGAEVPRLIGLSRGGANPEAWGVIVWEQLSQRPNDLDLVAQLLQSDGWPGTFYKRYPDAGYTQPWFRRFFHALEGQIFEDGLPDEAPAEADLDSTRGRGDPADVGGDETTEPGRVEVPVGTGVGGGTQPGGSGPVGNGGGGP